MGDHSEERGIGDKAKAAVKQMVANELVDDILCTIYHNSQSGIFSVVNNVLGQVKLDRLSKEVIGETPNAYIAKSFDMDAAADSLSKKRLSSSSYTGQIATFVQRKTDTAIAAMKPGFTKASKMKLVAATDIYGDNIGGLQSCLDLESEEPHRRRSSRW